MKLPSVDKRVFIFLVALVFVLLGIMTFINSNKVQKTQPEDMSQVAFDKEIQNIKTQSASDDIDSIQKDLNDTDYSKIDTELNQLDKEINSTK